MSPGAGAGGLDARRFGFAVMADSHIEPEAADSVPRSNRRTRAAVEVINRRRPAFVVHLGDLVHPVPALPGFEPAAGVALEILGQLACPLYTTPGNHDIGDKPLPWMPAKAVTREWVELYERRFQPAFQAFEHGGCRFLLLNSPGFNAGLHGESDQRARVEAELQRGHGERIFLFTHYPPYLLEPGEEGHYDNVDEPARSWLLGLLRRHDVEALFAGHVHNLFYDRYGRTDLYVAPSTSFVRRDYSELFRIESGSDFEFGRNDAAKLGYLWVDVHERGHHVAFHRSADLDGREAEGDASAEPSRLGVFLRHPWCEVVELPYNPPTDELQRRRVRNDYPVWTLWDLGIGAVRVPLGDLRNSAARMRALRDKGLRFTVFSFGAPDAATAALLAANADAVAAWEVVLPLAQVGDAAAVIREVRRRGGLRVLLAPLQTSAGGLSGGTNLTHFVGQGFGLDWPDAIEEVFELPAVREAFDGCVVRIGWPDDPWGGIAAVARLTAVLGIEASAAVSLSPLAPDGDHRDDAVIADRVAMAAFAAAAYGFGDVFFDTFMDVDRGYYVRHGLVDRRCNARRAGAVVRNLQRALMSVSRREAVLRTAPAAGGEAFVVAAESGLQCLLIGAGPIERIAIAGIEPPPAGAGRCVDLATGSSRAFDWDVEASGAGRRLRVRSGASVSSPSLLLIVPG